MTDEPYRCEGCGKQSRITAHGPGCPVAAAFDARERRAESAFGGNVLPPFPVDDVTLDLLWNAMNPRELDPGATTSGTGDVLTMMDRLGGSDPTAIAEVLDDGADGGPKIHRMRDQSYHPDNVIEALIVEIRRLRGLVPTQERTP